jgi:hypothetical protein
MEMNHNQCQDLKARFEKASSETKTKHEEILQNLQKILLETEEKLRAAQDENRDLIQKMEELKTQADKAKVCSGGQMMQLYYTLLTLASVPSLPGSLDSSSKRDTLSGPSQMLTSVYMVMNCISVASSVWCQLHFLLRDGDGYRPFP